MQPPDLNEIRHSLHQATAAVEHADHMGRKGDEHAVVRALNRIVDQAESAARDTRLVLAALRPAHESVAIDRQSVLHEGSQ